VADDIQLWSDFTRNSVSIEQVEDSLLVVLTQSQESAIIFSRFWIFC
jgi:hypothetical protein